MLGFMQNPSTQAITAKFAILSPLLDERARRLWAAAEARAIGRGGIRQVATATGLSRATIRAGLQALARPVAAPAPQTPVERVRRPGGGRKPLGVHDPLLLRALETWVAPVTRGDPMSLLRWTCKRAAKLAAALQTQGHVGSERTVHRLLHDLGYSLQANRKTLEGRAPPDRDAQCQSINRRAKACQRQGQPVVSVDTKKQALVGQFRQRGRAWHPQGQPAEVQVHDFPHAALGKGIP
jgi:transposase